MGEGDNATLKSELAKSEKLNLFSDHHFSSRRKQVIFLSICKVSFYFKWFTFRWLEKWRTNQCLLPWRRSSPTGVLHWSWVREETTLHRQLRCHSVTWCHISPQILLHWKPWVGGRLLFFFYIDNKDSKICMWQLSHRCKTGRIRQSIPTETSRQFASVAAEHIPV